VVRDQHPLPLDHSADADRNEVTTLVMSLPEIPGVRLSQPLSGSPIAAAPVRRTPDGPSLRLLLVTAELDPVSARRVRAECGQLEAILTGIDPALVLPIVDHGADAAGRPYVLLPDPGPALAGPLPLAEVVAAAQAAAEGLAALADRGVVGPPRGLLRTGPQAVALDTPLPPSLAELEASLGTGTGLEPPEVLGGQEWTPAGQVYACACLLWTLLDGRPPFRGGSGTLSRLLAASPPQMRQPVPGAVVDLLRTALAIDPSDRPATPAALARALRAAAEPPAEPGPAAPEGRELARQYVLETRIGSGASGEVWAARRIADGERVAIKVLRERLIEDEQAVARFFREYRVLLRVRHEHLVRVHQLVEEAGQLAIVMDLVDGEDLLRLARRGPIAVADAAELLSQTASGLAAVHAAGVVHRDVKPANVLVTERDGRPVALLSDFGIARAVEGAAHTQPIGTPAYLAPELVAGRPPTPAADIYALGITAYELLAGRPPFQADDVDALVRAHLDGEPARPDGLDDPVWDLLAACLRKVPEQRPSATDVAAGWGALARSGAAGHTAPPAARSPFLPAPADAPATLTSARRLKDRPRQPPPRRSRRRLILAGVAAAVVGLGGGVLLALRAAPDGKPPPPPAAQQYPVASTATVDTTTGVATVSWTGRAAALPGFDYYLVLDVSGEGIRPLSTELAADATSYQVKGLRPGRRSCYLVIAVGVTASPPSDVPPFPCVTLPSK
jgi:serine/threonine-protein kinase